MNKKIIIPIISIVIIAIIGITVFIIQKNKAKPDEIWQKYVTCLNEQKYDEMYDMLTEEAKGRIEKEAFVTRNKNIYEGMDMADMKVEIQNVEKFKDYAKISYKSTMETGAGNIQISNSVKLMKNKKHGYLVDWNHNLIFPQLGATDKVRIKTISAARGEIYDRNDNLLAGGGTALSVGIVPEKLGDSKEESINQIAELLGVTAETINKSLSAGWVKSDSFVPIKKIAKDETELKEKLLQISGVKITTSKERTYPLGEVTAHLTGYVQNITAEELKENQGKGYTNNSVIGKAGLEKQYEERLKGKDGLEIYIEDETGKKKAEITKIEVQNGEKIKLTIDSELQTKLYNELKDNKGLFVVMHPKTGELLALVSTPSYNPNKFITGLSTDEWNEIKENADNPMMARYLQTWCPGSTFKPVTGAIGLTSGTLSTEDTFEYSGLSWKKDNSWGDYNITTLTAYNGLKNLRNALIHSDNIYFAQATLKIGKDSFTKGLKNIKFGEAIDFGLVANKSQYSNSDEIKSETQLADSGYGQGQILVNPVHMASIYSAFANDGNMIKPYLEYKENKNVEYLVKGAFTKEAANTIKEDLIQVVENPEGTANDMKVSGRTIAGKTGTAELKGAKGEEAETIGWFDCFTADDNQNQLLVVGMVEDGRDLGGSHYLIKKIKQIF